MARSMTSGRTPWARMTTAAPWSTSSSVSTVSMPEPLEVGDHALVVDDLAEGMRRLAGGARPPWPCRSPRARRSRSRCAWRSGSPRTVPIRARLSHGGPGSRSVDRVGAPLAMDLRPTVSIRHVPRRMDLGLARRGSSHGVRVPIPRDWYESGRIGSPDECPITRAATGPARPVPGRTRRRRTCRGGAGRAGRRSGA